MNDTLGNYLSNYDVLCVPNNRQPNAFLRCLCGSALTLAPWLLVFSVGP
jgi:hypothetical protein